MNIRIDIEYDGSGFYGWQRQLTLPTVQETLEKAVEAASGKWSNVCGAGRTDTGVHAKGQVAHFSSDLPVPPEKWWQVLNKYLPETIRVISSCEVPEGFHAQRSSSSKIYEYRILNRATPSALDRYQFHYHRPLDWDAIREGMRYFLGTHDFKSFQSTGGTVKTTVRCIHRFELLDEGGGSYRFVLEGSGFLKQMVRNIIGTLLEVGEGKRSPQSIMDIIDARERQKAGRTAPARGLCLVQVKYPEEVGLGNDSHV